MSIGSRIKERRLEFNMSADKLGKLIGVNKTTIYRYEKGFIKKMPIKVAQRLSEVLDIPPYEFMEIETLDEMATMENLKTSKFIDFIEDTGFDVQFNEDYSEFVLSYKGDSWNVPLSDIELLFNQYKNNTSPMSIHLDAVLLSDLLDNFNETLSTHVMNLAELSSDNRKAVYLHTEALLKAQERKDTMKEQIMTIAAHIDDDATEEDLEEIQDFINKKKELQAKKQKK
ncbi:hypothetical protein EP56_08105 [Listeriaceae bacterium FSL A5-0209]|nr:hypothetical protein EP56_08105 [Listeriaceae bacterium FSL A5-0209]